MKLPPFSFLLGLAAAVLVSLAIWKYLGFPVNMVDAPSGKVHCVSYTPFRGAESPFDPDFRVNTANVDQDLALLSRITNCVRTYSIDGGLDQILPLAEKRGMQVMLGLWINADSDHNEAQVTHALALAERYKKTIKSIVVGNEVLLRGEQTPEELVVHLDRIRKATDVPITYADVTDFWLKASPALAASVDFITIHILPYWENDPRSAAHGVAYLDEVRREVASHFPGRSVFIGETGYPSQGRQRYEAAPSLVAQALYMRGLADYAEKHALDYNLIEAFDQPWKRTMEGTVGGHWGFFTTEREPKFPWTGPVSNYENWRIHAGIAIILSVLLLGVILWRGEKLEGLGFMAAGAAAGIAASSFILQIEHSWIVWRSAFEAAGEILLALQSLAVLLILLPEATKYRNTAAPVPVARVLAWLRAPKKDPFSLPLCLGLLRLTVICSALVISLGLSFDGRYLDFPVAAFLVPAFGFALMAFNRGDYRKVPDNRPEEALLAALLIATSAIVAFNEGLLDIKAMASGLINVKAMVWCFLNLLLALPWVLILWTGLRKLFIRRAARSAR